MDHQEIVRQFAACIVCSQQICRHFAPRLGIDDSLALRMAAAFGSGMGHAGTCGCFTGAMPPLRRSLPPGAWQPAVPRHPRHRHLVPRRHGPGLCARGLQHCLRAAGGPHMRAAGVRLGQAIEAAGAQQRRSSLPGTLRSPRRRPCAPRRRGQMKKGRSLKGPGLRLSVIKKC